MIKIIMAQNTYSIKEIGIEIVRYFTISRVVVSIKQEPIKQEKYSPLPRSKARAFSAAQ